MLILNLTYIWFWDVFKYLIDIVTLFNRDDYIHNKLLSYIKYQQSKKQSELFHAFERFFIL